MLPEDMYKYFGSVNEKEFVKEARRMVEVDIHVKGLEEAAAQSRTHLAQSLSLFNSTTQSLSFYLEPAGGTMMYAKVLYNLYTTNTAAPCICHSCFRSYSCWPFLQAPPRDYLYHS